MTPKFITVSIPYTDGMFKPWEFDVPMQEYRDFLANNDRIFLKIDVNSGYIYDWPVPVDLSILDRYWTLEYSGPVHMELLSEDGIQLAVADTVPAAPLHALAGTLLLRVIGTTIVNINAGVYGPEWIWTVPEANPDYIQPYSGEYTDTEPDIPQPASDADLEGGDNDADW